MFGEFEYFGQVLICNVIFYCDELGFVMGDEVYFWCQNEVCVNCLVYVLQGFGFCQGDYVVVWGNNLIVFVEMQFVFVWFGMVIVFLNICLMFVEVCGIFDDVQVKVFFFGDEYLEVGCEVVIGSEQCNMLFGFGMGDGDILFYDLLFEWNLSEDVFGFE